MTLTTTPKRFGAGRKAASAGGSEAAGGRSRRPRPAMLALLLGLAALALLYVAGLAYLRPASTGRELTLDQLIRFAQCATVPSGVDAADPRALACKGVDRKVRDVTFLDEDARMTGTLAATDDVRAQRFWTAYPRSDAATNDLLKSLAAGGTRVAVDPQAGKGIVRFLAQFLLPLMILANLFAMVFLASKGAGGGTAEFLQFGRMSSKKVDTADRRRVTFADVAGAEEAITELSEVRDYLAYPKAFEAMGALPPKGVLLMGPPGCGKTLLARAVAGEAAASFYSISGSEFVESLVGVGAARVRDLFRQARAAPPALIFIDELDAAGRQRGAGLGGGNDEREQTLNELLVQMDGFSPSEGIVVVAATNRPDVLDPALLRAGRFDRHITLDRPDLEGRLAILRLHIRSRRLADSQNDLPAVARRTPGFTGAGLANVVNEAALLAVRERAVAISRDHLEEAVDRVLSGPRRRARLIPEEEKRRIAHHEAGHAVVAASLGKKDLVEKVSVVARGGGVGHLAMLEDDKAVLTRLDMEAQVCVAMAGIAAEEMVFGQPSTGSEQDLERATDTARDMAGRYGMSSRLGRVRVLRQQGEVFLGRDYLSTQDVSQPTLENLDAEVRRILDQQEAAARFILEHHRNLLDELAGHLIQSETVQGPGLAHLLARVRPYVPPVAAVTTGAGPPGSIW